MGWTNDDGTHEGWCAAQLPDGRLSLGSAKGGMMVARIPPVPLIEQEGNSEYEEGVDGRQVIGWRAACTGCGWHGPLWMRVNAADQADPDNHKVYVPDPGPYGDAPDALDDVVWREWRDHLRGPEAEARIAAANQKVVNAQRELTQEVVEARRGGLSWSRIGAAVRITRQAAWERWSPVCPPSSAED